MASMVSAASRLPAGEPAAPGIAADAIRTILRNAPRNR